VQRLFSVFPEGWPGTGLLLLRAIAVIPLLQFFEGTAVTSQAVFSVTQFFAAVGSAFVALGLWTPIAASLMSVSELCLLFLSGSASSTHGMLAVLGASIAMIGPGAWSVDARLFGRKRIRIPER
jgi:uncharacterized membrane protein YphA (DoxX/SURF4 family)